MDIYFFILSLAVVIPVVRIVMIGWPQDAAYRNRRTMARK